VKAAYYESTGPAREVLRFGELPDPHPGPGEVRVRVHWSGLNPSDVKTRAGLRSKTMPFPRVVPHSDGAGVIDRVGDGVSAARLGERVWVWNAARGRPGGTAAEFVALPSRQAVALPADVPMEAGACFGIPALTALHAVQGYGGVRGKSVLVAGGAGAVGHYSVQFARRLGARQVLATISSQPKAALALQAGADATIDYRQEDVSDRVRLLTQGRGVDRIIEVDVAVNALLDVSLLRPGGDVVVYGSSASEIGLPFHPLVSSCLSLHFFIVYNLADEARARAEATLARLLRGQGLTHNIARRLPLSDIVQAHELVESGAAIGNVVLSLQ